MNPVPAVIVGGWNAGAKHYFGLARMVSRGGSSSESDSLEDKSPRITQTRRVFLIDSPHGTDAIHSAIAQSSEPKSIQARAATMAGAFQKLNIQNADVIAHSQGAYYAALFALAYPKRVRMLLAIAPAGISTSLERKYGNYFIDSYAHLAAVQRLVLASGEHISKQAAYVSKYIKRYFAGDMRKLPTQPSETPPVHVAESRALFSMQDLARADIRGLLSELRKHGKAVGIIYMDNDVLFPAEKMEEALSTIDLDLTAKHSGTHTGVFDDKAFGKDVVRQFAALEKKCLIAEGV